MKEPSGEKEGFTVTLTVRADGVKCPAVIVFKGSKSDGELSDRIKSKLDVPSNVFIESSKNAWWTSKLDEKWIRYTFPECEEQKILIRDQAPVHCLQGSEKLFKKRNVKQIFIPASRTGDFQPLDVSINRPFKVYYRDEYAKWRKNNRGVTKAGNLKKPSRQDFINFVSEAWKKVSPDCVRNSFVAAKIVSSLPLTLTGPSVEIESEELERCILDD